MVRSDKCAAVMYVWNKDLHINVRVSQTVRLIILQNIQQQGFETSRIKFFKIGPLFVGMTRLVTGISEGKERL